MTIAQELGITEFPFEIRNSNGKLIYRETSTGYWFKKEYDANGNLIYWETNDGIQVDKRPKTVVLTLDEIAQKFGIDVNHLKIKK